LTYGYYEGGRSKFPYSHRLGQLFDHQKEDIFQKMNFEFVNAGICGEKAVSMAPRLNAMLSQASKEKKSFDVAIILAGTNDICRQILTGHIISQLKQLHSQCHTNNIDTIALTIPELAFELESKGEYQRNRQKVNQELSSFGKQNEKKMAVIDLSTEIPYFSLKEEERQQIWDDGVHFTQAGYQRLADIIFPVLKKMILVKHSTPAK